MDIENQSIPARILLYSTAAVILTIGMREIASILTVFFFSVFIALILTPLVRWLKKKKESPGTECLSGNSFIRLHCPDSWVNSCQCGNPIWKPDPAISKSVN